MAKAARAPAAPRRARQELMIAEFFRGTSDSALASQVKWLHENIQVNGAFFADILAVNEERFGEWYRGTNTLTRAQQTTLVECWRLFLHLLKTFDFDPGKVHTLCHHLATDEGKSGTAGPPWQGTSLICYLQKHGPNGLKAVASWFAALRSANPS